MMIYNYIDGSLGNSRYSMTYLDDETLLLTVYSNHCIESVDLSVLSQPITYAGLCGSVEVKHEGHRLHDARMYRPAGILSLGENLIYFTTFEQNYVYMINDLTDQVSILSRGIPHAKMLTYDPHHNALLLPVEHGIMRVNISDGSAVWLSGSTRSGARLNNFHNVGFLSPFDTVVLSDTTIIISDNRNR